MSINLDNIRGITAIGKDIRQVLRKSDGKILWAGEHYIVCNYLDAGETVTATHSSGRTYNAIANSNGVATITVYDDGNFNLATNRFIQSKNINVPASTETVSVKFNKYLYLNGIVASGLTINQTYRVNTSGLNGSYGVDFQESQIQCYGSQMGHYFGDAYNDAVYAHIKNYDLTAYKSLIVTHGSSYSYNDARHRGQTGFCVADVGKSNHTLYELKNGNHWYAAPNEAPGDYKNGELQAGTRSVSISDLSGNYDMYFGCSLNYTPYGQNTANMSITFSDIHLVPN